MAKLTEADRKFLTALRPDGSPTGSWHIPTATREQDWTVNNAARGKTFKDAHQ